MDQPKYKTKRFTFERTTAPFDVLEGKCWTEWNPRNKPRAVFPNSINIHQKIPKGYVSSERAPFEYSFS